jgi:tetratricopeptide (TPR) repeat protein
MMTAGDFDLCFVPYIYSVDENGVCNAKHSRETIIKKRPDIYWKKKIHENIFIDNPKLAKICHTGEIRIIHNLSEEHALASQERNLKILMEEYNEGGKNTDPRTVGYIGRVLVSKREFKKAIPFLELLIEKSGWEDDKYFAWIYLSNCYSELNNPNMAMACCFEALTLNTTFPDAYLKLGSVYLYKKEYQKALDWLMPGLVRPEPKTMFVVDPSVYGYRARLYVALTYLGMANFKEALRYFNAAKQMAPKNTFVKTYEKLFNDAYYSDQYIKNFIWFLKYHEEHDKSKIPALFKAVDKDVLRDDRIWSLKSRYLPPEKWADNSVVIYCGKAWEDWAPVSVHKGIGGSEEAVIYLSQELTKLGWDVTVFNSCGELEGEYGGVKYRNFWEFSANDEFNIVISWRNNIFNELNIKAKKKLIWMHDVPYKGMFEEYKEGQFDKTIVLSEYHKSIIPKNIPQDAVYVSANGINLPDFCLNGLYRNPKRVIYTSSYDRGLIHLLNMWDEVLKEVPDAELHIFYGWETWISMEEKGFRPKEPRILMQQMMKKDGVFEHGRVGHKRLAKEFAQSGVYAYPSHFCEISCISAMKAQAAGCVCLTTGYAALNETNKYGIKIEGKAGEDDINDKFKSELIKLLKDKDYQEKTRALTLNHRDEWGWDKVAKDWSDNLFK